MKNNKRKSKRIYGLHINTNERIEFDSIYKASITLSGKNNIGLISNSLNHTKSDGRPIVAYGYVWHFLDEDYIKTPISVSKQYVRIPKEDQKKRGPICSKPISKLTLEKKGIFKCYVYDEEFKLVNKFIKMTECAEYYKLKYRSVISRCYTKLTKESRYPRFINGLYFQKNEINKEVVDFFLNYK